MTPTVGQKIKSFLFTPPTEETLGLPPATGQGNRSPSVEIRVIEHVFAYPFGEPQPFEPVVESTIEAEKDEDNRNFRQKIVDFLFVAPTEESLGLPQPCCEFTKSEAMEVIEEAWAHPFAQRQPSKCQ